MTAPVYPATTSAEAVALTISNANQLHEVVNGDTETVVETFEGLGSIPSVAKALKDAAAYKVPTAWAEGVTETELLQPRIYEGSVFVPLMAPAPMGVIPDSNWRLYSPVSKIIVEEEVQYGSDIVSDVTTFGTISYAVGENNLQVYVDGSRVFEGIHYNETSPTSITWLIPIDAFATIVAFAGSSVSGDLDYTYLLSILTDAQTAASDAEGFKDGAEQAAIDAANAAASVGGYNVKNVTSPYTILTGNSDNNSVLVFDTASAVTINVPDGITIGSNVSYRNKQGGVITITPQGSMTLEGAGGSTNDSTKVNSLYIESSTIVVTVGDMV